MGEIDSVKFLAWKSGGVIFFDKFHVCVVEWRKKDAKYEEDTKVFVEEL